MSMKLGPDNNRGFTLIEILVVLGLTMMIMALILVPLTNSLKITRSAEVMIKTQDNARYALAQVSRDLSNAMFVYDNTRDYIYFPINSDTSSGPDPIPLIAPTNAIQTPQVFYAKVDLVLPRQRGFCPVDASHTPGGARRGDEAAPSCPVCGEQLDLRPIQPLAADTKIVRYFIGLKDPTQAYVNGYNKLLSEEGGDNTFILYRAEFDPSDPNLFPPDASGAPRPVNENLEDPGFFYNLANNPSGVPYAVAWRNISKPIVTLEDIDLAVIDYNTPSGNPVVTPSVKFAPTAIYNDPLVPTTSDETNPEMASAAPAVYKATYGNWVLPYKVILEPEGNSNITFQTMPGRDLTPYDPKNHMCIYKVDKVSGAYQFAFNITHYDDTRSNSISGAGEMWPFVSQRERAFTVDRVRGTVSFAFPNVVTSGPLSTRALCTLAGIPANQQVPLSDLIGTSRLLDTVNNPAGRHEINCVHTDGTDHRILPNSVVVPGSVKVTAPNASSPTTLVAYTRTPYFMRDPAPNQFSVDYAHDLDQSGNSSPGAGAIYFHKPRTVDPGMTGKFLPGSNNVLIYYEVQNNMKGDVLRANYVTKSVMTVTMGIRIWDGGTGRPQSVQFTNKIRLKNIAS